MTEEELRKHPRELVIFWTCDCAERALLRERSKGREPDFGSWNAVSVTRLFLRKRVAVEVLEGAKIEAWSAYESAQSDWIEYMRRAGVAGTRAPAGGKSSSSAQAAQCAVGLAAWPSEGPASWEFPFMAKQAPNHAMRAAQWSAGGIAGSVRDAVYVAETAWQKRRLSWLAECWESYGEECLDLIFREEIFQLAPGTNVSVRWSGGNPVVCTLFFMTRFFHAFGEPAEKEEAVYFRVAGSRYTFMDPPFSRHDKTFVRGWLHDSNKFALYERSHLVTTDLSKKEER